MDVGAVYELPDHRRHLAVDERGVGLRTTCHLDRGFVNLSLWSDGRCVHTFHLTPIEAGRLVGFLASVLADGVPEPGLGSPVEAVPASSEPLWHDATAQRLSDRLKGVRCDLAEVLDRAARRLRP